MQVTAAVGGLPSPTAAEQCVAPGGVLDLADRCFLHRASRSRSDAAGPTKAPPWNVRLGERQAQPGQPHPAERVRGGTDPRRDAIRRTVASVVPSVEPNSTGELS